MPPGDVALSRALDSCTRNLLIPSRPIRGTISQTVRKLPAFGARRREGDVWESDLGFISCPKRPSPLVLGR